MDVDNVHAVGLVDNVHAVDQVNNVYAVNQLCIFIHHKRIIIQGKA